jgi:hypothetical protein
MKRTIAGTILGTIISATPAAATSITLGTGANVAAITPFRDTFRLEIGGGTIAGANGSFVDATGARREINWDGVPSQFSAPNNMPANFFNVNSPRGAVFATPGTGFQVSGATTDAGAGQPAAPNFGNIDASYSATFASFSPQRLFTALNSTITDVNFFVPGTNIPGVTSAFGVIFSDVDLFGPTTLQFFDPFNALLQTVIVPNLVGNQTFSFAGVVFDSPVVSRVRITSGNVALGAGVTDQNGLTRDVVVMDDFLYAEPVAAVPEPATLGLIGVGLVALARRHRARARG